MTVTSEFSRPIRVDRIGNDDRDFTFSANEEERAGLAARFDLVEIAALSGIARLRRVPGGRHYRLEASFEADVVQTCIVTLDPLPAHVADSFTMIFAPEDQIEHANEVVIGDEEDPPEAFLDGVIDIGEAVAEHLSLALDPFPRKADAALPAQFVEPQPDERPHPFAALAQLKKRLEN